MEKFKIVKMIGRKIVKHSPTICIVGGIGLTLIGIGAACKATYDHKEDIEECLKECHSMNEKEESKKEIAKSYGKCVKSMAKIYLPGSSFIFAGLFSMLFGHKILSKRHLALIAAYESLNRSYKNYRQNVKNDLGKETDICYRHNLKAEKLNDETVYVPADDIFIPDRDVGDLSVFFGSGWSVLIDSDTNPMNEPDINRKILREIEQEANDIFNQKGYIFLDDVYSMLGLIEKKAPKGVGWVKGRGDDYISFGIFEVANANAISGDEDIFLLDFNHDGYILPYI